MSRLAMMHSLPPRVTRAGLPLGFSFTTALLAIAACICPALADNATPRPPPEFYRITGTVANSNHGAIAGATVDISCQKPASIHSDGNGDSSSWRGVTDDKGKFQSLQRLRGNCRVSLTAAGFQSAIVDADLLGDSANVEVVLRPTKSAAKK
jgi:hypothetical protein